MKGRTLKENLDHFQDQKTLLGSENVGLEGRHDLLLQGLVTV